MDIAKWNKSYETGNKVVDTQHQELFRMVNALHAAILENRSKDLLMPTLETLANYAIEHFRSEEALMVEMNYPALAVHKWKHEDLTREVKELVGKYKSGQVGLTVTLSNFLANWLQHHIKEDDMDLIRYCQAQAEGATASSSKS
ncbi:MAG TPA: bacteriohemerythrin [Candidatus Sulfotelmatobacter sp.]|nr:bacteriohemerythrin [Candidatus Sulfotelmatobacter sp.]